VREHIKEGEENEEDEETKRSMMTGTRGVDRKQELFYFFVLLRKRQSS